MIGIVGFVASHRGYGTLYGEDGSSTFFHSRDLEASGIVGGVQQGDRMSFELGQNKFSGQPKAVNMRRLP